MKYSKGIMWLDDCRIPFVDDVEIQQISHHSCGGNGSGIYSWNKIIKKGGSETYETNTKGRFTPNLLVCDDMLNDGSVSKSQKTNGINTGRFPNTIKNGVKYEKEYERGFTDKGSNSRYYDLDKWFDKMLYEI